MEGSRSSFIYVGMGGCMCVGVRVYVCVYLDDVMQSRVMGRKLAGFYICVGGCGYVCVCVFR